MSETGETPTARILRIVTMAADYVAAAMLLVIFVTLVAQTFMRYVMRSPLSTSQELATITFLWMVFWAAGTTIRFSEHIRFDILYNALGPQSRRIMAILANAFYLVIFVWAGKATWDYFLFLETQYTGSLAISYQIAFFPYFIFFVAFPLKILAAIASLVGRDWRQAL
ncbi:MAG: TRAP transporter small permease [Rhizobiaceae bacterium]